MEDDNIALVDFEVNPGIAEPDNGKFGFRELQKKSRVDDNLTKHVQSAGSVTDPCASAGRVEESPLPLPDPDATSAAASVDDDRRHTKAAAPDRKQSRKKWNMSSTVQLPQSFVVKYLGKRDARGLWGIRYTRKPVEEMVAAAKAAGPGTDLPQLQMNVSAKGINMIEMPPTTSTKVLDLQLDGGFHTIDTISYGVQDLVYTRVFAMIMVKEPNALVPNIHPFECHAFVCDSRKSARNLTFALATAFQEFSNAVKGNSDAAKHIKKFAIDLRTPEEIEADLESALDADSEA